MASSRPASNPWDGHQLIPPNRTNTHRQSLFDISLPSSNKPPALFQARSRSTCHRRLPVRLSRRQRRLRSRLLCIALPSASRLQPRHLPPVTGTPVCRAGHVRCIVLRQLHAHQATPLELRCSALASSPCSCCPSASLASLSPSLQSPIRSSFPSCALLSIFYQLLQHPAAARLETIADPSTLTGMPCPLLFLRLLHACNSPH